MRGRKVESLPPNWTLVPLGEVAEVQLGKMLSQKARTGHGARPYLRNVNVRWHHFDLDDLLVMDFSEREVAKYTLQEGDVLVCEGGEPGRAAVWRGQIPGIMYQKALHRVRPRDDVLNPQFLVYQLEHDGRNGRLSTYFTGSTIKHLPREALLLYPVRLPPRGEQDRIVDSLDAQFTRLAAAVAALERVRANLKRYRAAVLTAACEGRLVPTEAELARREGRDYEPADVLLQRILRERRARWEAEELERLKAKGKPPTDDRWKQKYKEPEPPDTNELPQLPEGWVWTTVDQLAAPEASSITDGPFGSNLKTAHYTQEGPRVVRLQNIGDGDFVDAKAHISQSHFERLQKHRVFPGDLVIASLGSELPRACVVPDWLGDAIVKADCIRFKPAAGAAAQYLNIALNAEPTRARVAASIHGMGRPRLGLAQIRKIAIPLPSTSEQNRIVAEVERLLSLVAAAEHTARSSLRFADTLRRSILKRAFEGRLVPQDPNDEPASALLERIHARRHEQTELAIGRSAT